MAHEEHHEHILKELANQLSPVFANSSQAIYLYLDDEHKICNQKFVELLEYGSISEWAAIEAPIDDILEDDQSAVIDAYVKASEKLEASKLSISVVNKKGEEIPVSVIMTPITYKDEVFVIHFISPVN